MCQTVEEAISVKMCKNKSRLSHSLRIGRLLSFSLLVLVLYLTKERQKSCLPCHFTHRPHCLTLSPYSFLLPNPPYPRWHYHNAIACYVTGKMYYRLGVSYACAQLFSIPMFQLPIFRKKAVAGISDHQP